MILVSLITASLLAGSFGKSFTECSFGESEQTSCLAAAGNFFFFKLMSKDFEDLKLLKDGKFRIFRTVNESVIIDAPYTNKVLFFKNGTIKLNNVSKKDAGNYTLEEFNYKGKRLRNCSINLKVFDPVSVLTVSQQCLSPEQKKVTCLFEGDEAALSLTLNDHLLLRSNKYSQFLNNDTSERSRVFNVSVIIHGQLLGNITCKVWNNVSRNEMDISLTACNGAGSQPFFVVAVAAITALVSLLVYAALTATLIKLCKKQRAVVVNAGDSEDNVIYTDVTVNKRKTEARLQDSARQQFFI
ncbi:uncharacterized protein LOC112142555 isoform X2 [Oryzias melastigma]|uniref:uncharacterized protein LOC112142555 isoform X2 n=1 Tax=Oryzias melastigma TaxID=30732 RepID=UPI00168CCACF|nr:uncharacterized protein LOC112142555 isoform X2 [Oryzias melastigma]